MPSRLALRGSLSHGLRRTTLPSRLPICFFCSFGLPGARGRVSLPPREGRRFPSSTTGRTLATAHADASTSSFPAQNPRKDLENALLDLQKHASSYINISRVQLAIQGLRQDHGRESVRLAVLGLGPGVGGDGARSGRAAARGLLRSILADPLGSEQSWEGQLADHDDTRPLLIRVRPEPTDALPGGPELLTPRASENALPELPISSPLLNGNGLEILLTAVNPPVTPGDDSFLEAALVPAIDIPTSSTGRLTQITTPVHKALVVADGIPGLMTVSSLPRLAEGDQIAAAVNLKNSGDDISGCPFVPVDLESSFKAVELFRQDVGNAMKYEELWSRSNVQAARDWLLAGAVSNDEGVTKQDVRKLVESVLRSTLAAAHGEETRMLSSRQRSETLASAAGLERSLTKWAEEAHSELQEQLDAAFMSRRWRKLGWWKLFWRVDDVSMLSSEMIAQRFLPGAERSVIYLAGRIRGANRSESAAGQAPGYSLPVPVAEDAPTDAVAIEMPQMSQPVTTKWPTHISHTKRYLLDKAVPSLQALAQKLVVQTLSTSTLTTSLGVLAYLSSFGIYESGAVAALGTVWALRRMQTKWETARGYWEGEIREEGRKAVRAVEASVADVLDQSRADGPLEDAKARELERVRSIVRTAEEALEKLK